MGSFFSRLFRHKSKAQPIISPVNRLPDCALLSVFKQLPPQDQMSASKVCIRWCTLVHDVTRGIDSLSLLIGPGTIRQFEDFINVKQLGDQAALQLFVNTMTWPSGRLTEWNSVICDLLDNDTVDEITDTFTNITELQIYIRGTSAMPYCLVNLLNLCRPKLTTLKLYNDLLNSKVHDAFTKKLFDAINSMPALKNLTLDLGRMNYRDLPILGQLEEFAFIPGQSCSQFANFANSLERHAKNNSSLHIETEVDVSQLTLLYNLSGHLRDRFVRLNLDGAFPGDQLQDICSSFHSLTFVAFKVTNMSLRHLFAKLSHLPQLAHLVLNINFGLLKPDHLQGHRSLAQLPTVKALILSLNLNFHENLLQLKLAWTMPNIEVIHVYLDDGGCSRCGIKNITKIHLKANQEKGKQCLRQMFRPLKRRCKKLRKILHGEEDILGSVEELLAD